MARSIAIRRTIADTRSPAAQETLTEAVLRASDLLNVSQNELAAILGVSPATISRMSSGRYLLQTDRKEWQLAVLFVRFFRSLDSITAGKDDLSRAWLRGHNDALNGVPAALLGDIESFVRVVQYLDASRASV